MSGYETRVEELRRTIEEVTVDYAYAQSTNNGFALIDVRDGNELMDGIAAKSVHIPRSVLEFQIGNTCPDPDMPVMLICASGLRSLFAADSLRQLGYQRVINVIGGFKAWKEAGLPVEIPKVLGSDDKERYSRHLLIPEVGESGQLRLMDSKVLLIGAGGLGSPAALYLAAAGIGTLGIVDADRVELSNLQRQIVHGEDHLGQPKVQSAETAVRRINSSIEVVTYERYLDIGNVESIIANYDVVIDGSDNFKTRYLVNDACTKLGIPNVHGAVYRFDGYLTTFDPRSQSPCYRCFQPVQPPPEMAPSCVEAGVLGVVPGLIGILQALEAIKLILGVGENLVGKVLKVDTLTYEFSTLELMKEPECLCGHNRESIRLEEVEPLACAV